MAVNYWWVGVLAVLAIGLITWIIRRNRKDEKAYERELNQEGIKPEKHNEHREI